MARKTSFYYSFLVLPPEQRRAIVAVWDFCRAVDDGVDEEASTTASGLPTGRDAVAFWRAELAAAFEGGAPRTSQGRALAPFITQFELPRQAFEDVIDGVAMDLDTTRYATFDELFEYCRRVASAVGMICIRIFGCRIAGRDRVRAQPRCGAPAHQHPQGRHRRIWRAAASTCRSRIWRRATARSRIWPREW